MRSFRFPDSARGIGKKKDGISEEMPDKYGIRLALRATGGVCRGSREQAPLAFRQTLEPMRTKRVRFVRFPDSAHGIGNKKDGIY